MVNSCPTKKQTFKLNHESMNDNKHLEADFLFKLNQNKKLSTPGTFFFTINSILNVKIKQVDNR